MSHKHDVQTGADGQSATALYDLIQRMEEKLDNTVTQINQSVDQKLESGLATIQRRMDGELPSAKKLKLQVSEETKELVKISFTSTLSYPERKETKGRAPDLDLPETRCPKLDALFKTQESKFSGNADAKQVDNDLQKLQALMLDVAAPLLELKGFTEQESKILHRPPEEAIDDALKLLGNAFSQTSKVRRKRVLKACNPDIQDLAEEESLFKEAGPDLFGPEFEKKMKERAESVKILSKSQGTSNSKKFFRGGRHSQAQRGGGHPTGEAESNPQARATQTSRTPSAIRVTAVPQ